VHPVADSLSLNNNVQKYIHESSVKLLCPIRHVTFLLFPADGQQTTIFLDGKQERKGCVNSFNAEYKDLLKAKSKKGQNLNVTYALKRAARRNRPFWQNATYKFRFADIDVLQNVRLPEVLP